MEYEVHMLVGRCSLLEGSNPLIKISVTIQYVLKDNEPHIALQISYVLRSTKFKVQIPV
jgi:hypothetical protein